MASEKFLFENCILLKEPTWDEDYFRYHLKKNWDIIPQENFPKKTKNTIDCFAVDDIIVSVELIKDSLGVAEKSAEKNFFWQEAVKITNTHKAYLIISVEGSNSLVDLSEFFVKIVATCCDDENVLGVYTGHTVLEPQFYVKSSEVMREDAFPITNLVWFGAYKTQNGIDAYTLGMEQFGKKNLEIVNCKKDFQSIMEFLQDIASYVIVSDTEFKSRESIGLTENKLYEIFLSKGVSLPNEDTFKIDYH